MPVEKNAPVKTDEPVDKAPLDTPLTPQKGAVEVKQKPEDEDDDTVLLGSSTLPSSVPVGANEVTLGALVRESKKESGYSAKKWNELSDETRDEHLNKTLDRLRKDAEKKSSTQKDEADTQAKAEDVKVHSNRAVGGSYVALGGGERRRVAERSGGEVPPADEELAKA